MSKTECYICFTWPIVVKRNSSSGFFCIFICIKRHVSILNVDEVTDNDINNKCDNISDKMMAMMRMIMITLMIMMMITITGTTITTTTATSKNNNKKNDNNNYNIHNS